MQLDFFYSQNERDNKRTKDFRTATAISDLGDYITLKYFCQRALKDYPNDPDFWNFMGIAQLNTGDRDGAQSSFLRAYRFSWRKGVYLSNFLATCFGAKAIVTAFKTLEKEFPHLNEENKDQVIDLLEKLFKLEVLDLDLLHRWLSRPKVVSYHQFIKIFQFIARSRKQNRSYLNE